MTAKLIREFLTFPSSHQFRNTTIYSPSCYEELRLCLKKAVLEDSGIVAVRYPRGTMINQITINLTSIRHINIMITETVCADSYIRQTV